MSPARVIGVDPAPKKGLTVFDPLAAKAFYTVPPSGARSWLTGIAAESTRDRNRLLVGWDSPLIVDFALTPGNGRYTARPIERMFSRAARCSYTWPGQLGQGARTKGYAGLSHWSISLDVLGYPLPTWLTARQAYPRLDLAFPGRRLPDLGVVETHPAVALDIVLNHTLPRYKGVGNAVAQIAADARVINWATRFGVHPFLAQVTSDDELDALVSYLCTRGMVTRPRETDWLGSHVSGGFAVPLHAGATAMQRHFVNVALCSCRTCR